MLFPLLSPEPTYRQNSSPPHLPRSELDQVALEPRCGRPAGVGAPCHPRYIAGHSHQPVLVSPWSRVFGRQRHRQRHSAPGGRRHRPRRADAVIGRAWLACLAALHDGGVTLALHRGPATGATACPHFCFRFAGSGFGFCGTTAMVVPARVASLGPGRRRSR